MKKTLAILICILAAVFCTFAVAESAGKEDYSVVSVNGTFNIRGITPEGYQMADIQTNDSMTCYSFRAEDPARPYFDLVISFAEDYAQVERLNDLSPEEMLELVDDDPTMSSEINYMETGLGTKVMILRSNNPADDYACFVTIYKGHEVALNMFPGEGSTEPLTDEQITRAMQFLTDLDFVPVE